MRPAARPRVPLAIVLLLVGAMTLAGCSHPPADVDLASLARDGRPSEVLACPAGHCAAHADITVPDYPVAVEPLAAAVREAVGALPRTTIVRDDPSRRRLVAVQRTAVLRFADTFWIEIVARGPASSSVVIYSRPNFGYYDFGVNRRRVETLLAAIADRVATRR